MLTKHHLSNIYVIGSQCTGKTTLVNALQERLFIEDAANKPYIISEVARTVLKNNSFRTEEIRSSPTRSLALQKLILEAQFRAEEEALNSASWFISDRSGLDPIAYTHRYVGTDAAKEIQDTIEWKSLKARMAGSIIILCESGTPWLQNDGVRLMPESQRDWSQMHHTFCNVLDEVGLAYCLVPNTMIDIKERVDYVLQMSGLSKV